MVVVHKLKKRPPTNIYITSTYNQHDVILLTAVPGFNNSTLQTLVKMTQILYKQEF